MKQAAVADVDLGRSDLALTDVGEIGRQLADHERVGEQIEIAARGGLAFAEGAGGLGGVPDLAVVVGQHGPEAGQRGGRNAYPPLWQVALEQGADEASPPARAAGLAIGKVSAWESASAPQLVVAGGPYLGEGKAAQCDGLRAAGEALGGLAQQIARRAAEDEEPSGGARSVGKDAQHRKQVRAARGRWWIFMVDFVL